MNASPAEYTLLIVESPTLAGQLQTLAPQHVVVFSTGGFLWEPRFNPENGKLGRKALPDKVERRNELRTESRHAVKIIVATDRDPSGDFIAWTIFKEIPHRTILRGNLRSISHSALQKLLVEASPCDFTNLFCRLQNRFRIRGLWNQVFPRISMKKAGLLAVFGGTITTSVFCTNGGDELRSEQPVDVKFTESEFEIESSTDNGWIISLPLSSFDALELIRNLSGADSYHSAQNLLQLTFESKNVESGEGLISYPRTEQQSFFPDTWQKLHQQWIAKRSLNGFLPAALQTVTLADAAHDSIHPLDLNVTPDWVERHHSSSIARVYRLIHSHTLESIRMPEQAIAAFKDSGSDVHFTSDYKPESAYLKIKPVLTMSELGIQLSRLGVLRPSGFGRFVDQAIKNGWIKIDEQGNTHPGNQIEIHLEKGLFFSSILNRLRSISDQQDLRSETIRNVLTS